MGARENQGLQIALIIFVMITVVLAVTTYIYFKKAEEELKNKLQAVEDKAATEAKVASLNSEITSLKKLMGPEDAKLTDIEATFKADMSLYVDSYQGEKNYHNLAPFLVDEIVKLKAQLADAGIKQRDLETTITTVRAEETKLKEQKIAEAAKTAEELAKERAEFVKARETITANQTDLAGKFEAESKKVASITEVAAKQQAEAGAKLSKSEQLVDALKDTLEKKRGATSTEGADGKITYVNQGTKVVWINLGDADGLRRQISFSVVDRDANNPNTAKSKGKIEVTKILQGHLAEARIIEDDISDPIAKDDQIYTPVWAPGQKLRFALVGFMDIDGDGKSDRAKIKSIIGLNAGEVVAEVSEEGKRTGKIDIDTRYLIVGERPTDKTQPEMIQAYTSMTTEARRLGIEQLSVDRFLGLMGYKETNRTFQLGRGADSADYKAKPEDGVVRKSGGAVSTFKERTPPAAGGKKSAFP